MSAETIAVHMPTPALGPSLGVAPSGTWMCTSCSLWKSGLIPNEVAPLWSIELRPGAGREEHAAYRVHRDRGDDTAAVMWRMVTGG